MKSKIILGLIATVMVSYEAVAQFYTTNQLFNPTGISNQGVVAGYNAQAGPYYVWFPETITTEEIGGLAPGNGIGGQANFSADGNFISGTSLNTFTISLEYIRKIVPFAFNFKAIQFPESSLGYAIGQTSASNGNGIVIRTFNGGGTWKQIWEDTEQRGLEAMSFPSSYTGYIGGWNRYFAKTTSGGWDWEQLNPGGSNVVRYTAIDFINDTIGVAGAELTNGSAVFVTLNGGTTWITATGVSGRPVKITHTGNNTYFMITHTGKIQKSVNNGLTWTTLTTFPQAGFLGIKFFDNFQGIITALGNIYKTNDGGLTWALRAVNPGVTDNVSWNDVDWIDANKIVVVGSTDKIYQSEDGGDSWSWVNQAAHNGVPELFGIDVTDTDLHVCGSDGNFYKKSLISSTEVAEMSRYDVSTHQWLPLGSLGFIVDGTVSGGYAVSGDGKMVSGNSWSDPEPAGGIPFTHAVAWSQTDGIIDLGSLYSSTGRSTRANALNYDGSIIVGWQDLNGPWKSAVWRKNPAGGYYPNEYLLIDPNGNPDDEYNQLGECSAISADGKWIGGYGDFANNNQPWIWSEASGVINLGLLAENAQGYVSGINADGTVVTGWFNVGPWDPMLPFIWTPTDGLQNLNTYITNTLGYSTGNKQIYSASGLSSNGQYICGWGIDNDNFDFFTFRVNRFFTGVNEAQKNDKLNVYPNPANDFINIDNNFHATLTISNAHGKIVHNAEITQNYKMNISQFPAGLYFISLKSEKENQTAKFIKK